MCKLYNLDEGDIIWGGGEGGSGCTKCIEYVLERGSRGVGFCWNEWRDGLCANEGWRVYAERFVDGMALSRSKALLVVERD